MELDAQDLKNGLKFIVGTWQVDFLVNIWSNNLDHIPATEFKSKDGKDFSQVSFEFFEDHTVKLKNGITNVEETGTWKQNTYSKFEYTCEKFWGDLPEDLRKGLVNVEKDMEGGLVFSFALFVVHMKKTAEGTVTEIKEPDIGDLECTPEELAKKDIVGRWKIYKAMGCVGEDFGMFTIAEIKADLEKKKAAGNMDERDLKQQLMAYGMEVEFTDDHKVRMYAPLPPDVSQAEIDEAVKSGQVKIVDGMIFDGGEKEWKFVKGEYWYNTEEQRKLFDEPVSPWDKITPDAEGHIDFKMWILERK